MTSTNPDDSSSRHGSPYNHNVLDWDVEKVILWVGDLGLAQYGSAFRENNIVGEALVYLSHSELSEIGVRSVGHRLKILKAIYQLIISQNLKLDSDYYIPPSVLDRDSALPFKTLDHLDAAIVQNFEVRDQRMGYAENEIQRLVDNYSRLREDLLPIFRIVKESKPLPMPDPSSNSSLSPNTFSGSQPLHSNSSPNLPTSSTIYNGGFQRSPTTVSTTTTNTASATSNPGNTPSSTSPNRFNSTPAWSSSASLHNMGKLTSKKSYNALNQTNQFNKSPTTEREIEDNTLTAHNPRNSISGMRTMSQSSVNSVNASSTPPVGSSHHSPSSEPFKAFRLTQDDPCYKVLPAALKKYKINGDWRQYALLVCYGDQERLLGLEEKPLVIFKELQDAGRRPVFMLRHMEGAKNNKQGGIVVNGTPGGVI